MTIYTSELSNCNSFSTFAASKVSKLVAQCRKLEILTSFNEISIEVAKYAQNQTLYTVLLFQNSKFQKGVSIYDFLYFSPSRLTAPKVPEWLQFLWNVNILLIQKIKFLDLCSSAMIFEVVVGQYILFAEHFFFNRLAQFPNCLNFAVPYGSHLMFQLLPSIGTLETFLNRNFKLQYVFFTFCCLSCFWSSLTVPEVRER